MGLSAARSLADRGHDVTVFEQHPRGHSLGSSHGRSRIVRLEYPDRFYTEILLDAYPLWHELEEAAGRSLIHECGLFYFGDGESDEIRSGNQALADLRIEHEILDWESVGTRFPALQMGPGEIGAWTPQAGWVRADEALTATWELAQTRGARWVNQKVESLDALRAEFEQVVVACGAWVRLLADLEVGVRKQCFAYVRGEVGGPVWIEGLGHHLYGFPSEPGRADFKVGVHEGGPNFDPDRPDREIVEAHLDEIREFARRRYGIPNPVIVESHACLYTFTKDEDFRIGRIDANTVVLSPCSGHGFKFGPWIGRLAADLVERRVPDVPYERFDPARPSS